jgi:hypothetical protein
VCCARECCMCARVCARAVLANRCHGGSDLAHEATTAMPTSLTLSALTSLCASVRPGDHADDPNRVRQHHLRKPASASLTQASLCLLRASSSSSSPSLVCSLQTVLPRQAVLLEGAPSPIAGMPGGWVMPEQPFTHVFHKTGTFLLQRSGAKRGREGCVP